MALSEDTAAFGVTEAADVVIGAPVEGDAAAVGPVHLQSWLATYVNPGLGVTQEWIRAHRGIVASPAGTTYREQLFAAQAADPRGVLYRTARRGGRLVGFLHADRPGDGHGAGHGHGHGAGDAVALHGLYLLPDAQGTGIADTLMRELATWAPGAPATLDVATYNHRAVRFYTRHGFTPTGATDLFAGTVPVMTMAKGAL